MKIMPTDKQRFIFLLSHPIQYFSPLFQLMAKDSEIDLLVLYCSDENVKGHIDKGFGVKVKWDIPLLEGYNYKFLKNYSLKPSIFNGFFGLMNFEIISVLRKEKGSYIVIHGWNYLTHIITILLGKLFGLKTCIRGDNPYKQEMLKSKRLLFIKRLLLGKILFKFIDYFLYVGNQNKEFYRFYDIPENKLISTPHAVDNTRFRNEYVKYKEKKFVLRKELQLPEEKIIILFVGKYIKVKRPLDLLEAFRELNSENISLIFLGDGELRKEMEEYIQTYNLKDVCITGFKNQSQISKYYSAADIFVLTSESETWGFVVNEAMNFGLPIILSKQVGCIDDLLHDGQNGFHFECANIVDLKTKLKILINDNHIRNSFGKESYRLIESYSYSSIINSLKTI
jgi:glycosyltransferase involved in cell wall biosynthesis